MIQSPLLTFARFIGGMTWLRRGIRERVIRLLRRLARAPQGMRFKVTLTDFDYEGTLDNFIDWNVYFYGIYEPEIVALFAMAAQGSPQCALDVGANVGHHSLLLSRLFRRVEAFEPWNRVRERLKGHLARNRIGNVSVHPMALGSASSSAPFYVPTDSNLGQGSLVPGHVAANGLANDSVSVERGDDYLSAQSIPNPGLVKIDVEGYEAEVLKGLRATLEKARPVVIFELSATTKKQIRSADELQVLFPAGYDFYATRARRVVLGIFEQPRVLALALDFPTHDGNVLAIPVERRGQFATALVA